MKRTIKTVAAFMIASSVLFTSCVKNEVSDNVAALRAQQVEIVTANAAFAQANAAYRAAQVTQIEMANTQQALTNEQDLRRVIAQSDAYVAQKLAEVKQAELNLQVAVNNLADYIAEHAIDNAFDYLSNYEYEMGQVNTYTVQRIYKLADIAIAELMLAEGADLDGGNMIVLENDLAHAQAELAALEASLLAYAGIANNPASLHEELDVIKVDITNMESDRSALEQEMFDKEEIADLADLDLNGSMQLINSFDNGADEIMALESEIADYNDNIIDSEANIADYNAAIADLNADISSREAILASLLGYRGAKDAADANLDAKQVNVDAAILAVNFAQANYDNDPSTANLTALTNSQTNLTNAQTAWQDAADATVLPDNNYAIAMGNAGGDEDFVLNQIENMQATIVNLEDAIASAEDDIAMYNSEIAANQFDIDRINAVLTSGQGDYDAALAGLADLADASNAAWMDYSAISHEVDAINIMIGAMWNVYNSVESDMDNIKNIMDGKENAIANKEVEIAGIEADIIMNDDSAAFLQAQLDDYNEDLVEIDASIAQHQALADEWMALLDAALGN